MVLPVMPVVMPRVEGDAMAGSKTRQLIVQQFEKRNLHCNIALEANSWGVIKCYVGLDLGITVIPSFCIKVKDRQYLYWLCAQHPLPFFSYRQ